MRAGLSIIFFFIIQAGFSQGLQYSLRNYKAIDGLPQSQVRTMLEDNNGYLWVGTEGGGLARFDGGSFKVYTTLDGLQSNIVTSLRLDSKQNLWIVHPRGISRFDGVSFVKFEQPDAKTSTTMLRRIFEQQDTIFFLSTPGYIGKIYQDSVYYWSKPILDNENELQEKLISFGYQTPDGELLLCIDQKSFYCRSNTSDFWIPFDGFNHIKNAFEYKDEFWLLTDQGYYSVDLQNRTFEEQTLPIKNHILYYDGLHNAFWTMHGNTLLKETFVNNAIKIDTVLRDVVITQVLVDSEGDTWLASNASGLFKYFIQDFDKCSSEKMKQIMSIFTDRDGARWIGSMSKGLWKIYKGKVKHYDTPPGSRSNGMFDIEQTSDGTMWVGSSEGLGKYNADKDNFEWTKPDPNSRFNAVINLQIDEQDGIWLGMMGGGVNYYDGKTFKNFSVDEGLSTNWIMALLYMQKYNTLFVGDEFGLSAIKDDVVQDLSIQGMGNTSIVSMAPLNDSLLLISSGGVGLIVYDPITKFTKFITTKEGLPSDFIYFAAQDADGYIWVGSERGITRIRLNTQFEVTENLHYDYDNGLVGVETNQNAYSFDGDEKFFGLIDGLYQFNNIKREDHQDYGIHLTDIQLLYGQFEASAYADSTFGFFKIPYNPSFPPDKNHVTFHFNRVDKRYPKSVKFKYQLEGFDKRWSQASSLSQVTYSNLPPGDYVFKVKSTDHKGSWSEKELMYPFSIENPFYTQMWFYVIMILFTGALIGLILFIRVRQRVKQVLMLQRFRIKEQEILRREIARDFHDEMGNQLTRIINYVSLLRLNGNNTNGHGKNNSDLYTKVEDSAKYLYTGTRDFIWSIDPVNDELSQLFIHIRDFGEKLFEEKNIKFRAYNDVKDKVKLPYGFSREANLIFKEVMTNAFKYSSARNVSFSLKRKSEDEFEFIFEDDGVGFDLSAGECSGGLKNIRERADKISAAIQIHSKPNEGTSIVLNFKPQNKLKYGITI